MAVELYVVDLEGRVRPSSDRQPFLTMVFKSPGLNQEFYDSTSIKCGVGHIGQHSDNYARSCTLSSSPAGSCGKKPSAARMHSALANQAPSSDYPKATIELSCFGEVSGCTYRYRLRFRGLASRNRSQSLPTSNPKSVSLVQLDP